MNVKMAAVLFVGLMLFGSFAADVEAASPILTVLAKHKKHSPVPSAQKLRTKQKKEKAGKPPEKNKATGSVSAAPSNLEKSRRAL